MTKKRIIPTILTDGVTVVKGKQFESSRTVGSAVSIARLFSTRDIDELMLLDVAASKKYTFISQQVVRTFSELLNIPFSVGGGISSLEIARQCIRNGAEKVVLCTAALENPSLIRQISDNFGSQAVVVAVDFVESENEINVVINSGSKKIPGTLTDVVELVNEMGAGEILLQSVNRDGCMNGYDLAAISRVAQISKIPIIASGGCGSKLDALNALKSGAAAVAAGALFQFTENTPKSLGDYLRTYDIPMRNI